ncbi:GNAT family N-acetyltransferase [Rhizobium sp. RM]|uniref:GNAT family N-acetyltransferase n=1 Tax=Rhizobium/Agrobacterium group TaxID=227290 RepID=UPI00110ECFD1|nr:MULTISPECIES: GNAT family N-acetyltransferase [Rhizobium/Agrobacterium group]NWJ23854.1 GNAT family N-acetyltransferase [Rhizobium sp. RM]TMV19716.1 GNAT family N-acetyltransferase [Rhizobium sp. Td3]UXS05246.1 GNAT family N-acetyltransferase [Agrobacterium tumefaciens]
MSSDPKNPDLQDPRIAALVASSAKDRPVADSSKRVGREGREFCIYPGQLGYEMQEELDFLSNRVMEANVFFTGRLLAPAMPRLEDKSVRFALIRDENGARSRMRLLMPFTVEKPGFAIGPSIIRIWANPFGPLGTPLVDTEGAAETLDNLFDALADKEMKLPNVLVLPDIRLDGPFARLVKAIALSRNLPLTTTGTYQRPTLESLQDGETYLQQALAPHHLREMRRQWRQLEKLGAVSYTVSRQAKDIRYRMEEFLALEASGWKGRKRSALVNDRYRAAFAREAITNLAEADAVRIHTIDLNGSAIASIVVFMTAGEAYTWKTAFDESYSKYSPGKLLIQKLTDWHLDDANILRSDSCAVPDHPIMSRFWQERQEMGTLIVGLAQNSDRDVRQVSTHVDMYRSTRNLARSLRQKIMSFGRKGS